MRRSINWRRSVILLIVATVCMACLYGLQRVQVGRSAGLFLQNAEQSIAEEDFTQALQSYRNYLRLLPADAEVRAKMGYLLADGGGYERAFTTLEEVVRQNPEDDAARRRLIEVAMKLQRFPDAQAHATHLLEIPDAAAALQADLAKEDAELVHLLGQSIQVTGRDQSLAASLLVRSIVLDRQQLEVYARLGSLLQNRSKTPLADDELLAVVRPEEGEDGLPEGAPPLTGLSALQQADLIMQALVDNNPDSAEAHVYLGNHLLRSAMLSPSATDAREEAAREAAEALRLAAGDPAALLLATRCEMACDRLESARSLALQGRDATPDLRHWYFLLSRLETLAGQTEESRQWLREGIRSVEEGKHELMSQLANMLVDQGSIDEANDVIAELQHFNDARDWLQYLTARVRFAERDWLAASQKFEAARPYFVDRPETLKQIDLLLGHCHRHLGDSRHQLTAYRRAVAADPSWVAARTAIVDALMAQGLDMEALRELRQLAQLVPTEKIPAATLLDLARLAARERLTEIQNDPNAAADWSEMRGWLQEAAARLPASPQVPILQAELLYAQGQADEAVNILTAAIEQQPDQLQLRTILSNLYARQGDLEKSDAVLDEAQSELGDTVGWRLVRAQRLAGMYGEAASDELRALAEPDDAFDETEYTELCYRLAVFALRIGDLEQARLLTDRLTEREPDNLHSWLLQLDLAQREETPDLSDVLQAVDRIQKNGPVWHYAHAVDLYLKASDQSHELLSEALSHLNEARSQRPGWWPPILLTARIQLMQGEPDAAVDNFVQAIELAPQSAADVRQTIQLLFERQRYEEADRVIQRVESRQQAVPAELGLMATEISFKLREYDRALGVAREMAKDSDDASDHVLLGKLAEFRGRQLALQGQQEESNRLGAEAERALRTAVELAAETPEPWVLLVRLFRDAGRDDEAQQTIEEMRQAVAMDELSLTTALSHETLGQWEESERHYVEAVAQAPHDPPGVGSGSSVLPANGPAG